MGVRSLITVMHAELFKRLLLGVTQGNLINCNLRIKDLWRMRMIVNAAVMRWAARDENW